MAISERTDRPYLVLGPEDYVVLGPEQFGSPGLQAIEILGPYADITAMGPLLTVHDSNIEPHLGIGHHPHRYNERIFYIMTGELDHDDRLNNIEGHMDTGDIGLFTEGRRGMVHSEWNNSDEPMHAFMIVYATDPVPEQTAFAVFKDAEAPRYDEAPGVRTKEMLGPKSSLRIHGDLRLYTDSTLEGGATLELRLRPGEGSVISVQEGTLRLDSADIARGGSVLFPPRSDERVARFAATGSARLLRIVHGPGFGLRLR